MNTAASLDFCNILIHRAKQKFESKFGNSILKELDIEGQWESISHVALGYATPTPVPKAIKKNTLLITLDNSLV